MPKLQGNFLDGGSDSDTGIKTDNEFAKNYDTWRKKEELNKCKFFTDFFSLKLTVVH